MVDFDFGRRLKELRLQAGLTQKQLASRIGVTTSVVSFYELRERTPSPEVLAKLSAIFHVSTDYLLGIEKDRTINVSGLDDDDIKIIAQMVEQLRRKNKRTKQGE
ncbi:MAG: helix-turn-helix transcriptional regulator [Lachnospiraceae bacterium]|nr:helix-turn-helix transcriptional regulator [Lachnospiraceae bacterium]